MRRKWRRVQQHLSVARVTTIVELLVFVAILLLLLTGKRAVFLDQLGSRGELALIVSLLGALTLLHWLVRRWLLPAIEHYFAPVPYDERRILFDLGQEARTVTSVDQLYKSIASRIASSLEASDVSIFVRDEVSGDYVCRVSTSLPTQFAAGAIQRAGQIDKIDETKLRHDAFLVRRLFSLSTPLVIEPAQLETWTRALSEATPELRTARAHERETLERIQSHLLVQVRTKDLLIGILSLGLRRGQFRYDDADKEVLMSVAAQLALVIENSRLAERMVAEERLRRELAMAWEVQRRLLPTKPPESVVVELAGYCEPAGDVGGDYYDFIVLDNQELGIAIADVAGKGMPAALLMSTMQATLRSLAVRNGAESQLNRSLPAMVATLNRLLFDSTDGSNYVTFFYAQFDPVTRRLTYVNAGHNPPFFMRASHAGDFQHLSSGGLIVGVFEHCSYEQETIQMESGDVLFAFTDGLTEALDISGEEFGETRVKETLAAHVCLSVGEIRAGIERRVKQWCAGAPQYDDMTFVVMKVK
jgi:sigma-B regulation protein RsbU (phosphoserine phosphatase)